jgi:hypothetical protein
VVRWSSIAVVVAVPALVTELVVVAVGRWSSWSEIPIQG